MFYDSQHILNIRLEFENTLKQNNSLAITYQNIVENAAKLHSLFDEEVILAQKLFAIN